MSNLRSFSGLAARECFPSRISLSAFAHSAAEVSSDRNWQAPQSTSRVTVLETRQGRPAARASIREIGRHSNRDGMKNRVELFNIIADTWELDAVLKSLLSNGFLHLPSQLAVANPRINEVLLQLEQLGYDLQGEERIILYRKMADGNDCFGFSSFFADLLREMGGINTVVDNGYGLSFSSFLQIDTPWQAQSMQTSGWQTVLPGIS